MLSRVQKASRITLATRHQLAVFLVALALISFPMHLAWEWMQCQPYFVHRATPATAASMLTAALGDVALTMFAYGVIAAIHDAAWPLRSWPASVWFLLMGMALITSVAVEGYALFTDRWAYTDAAPRLPGSPISVLPVAQLLIQFPVGFYLTRRLIRRVSPPGNTS